MGYVGTDINGEIRARIRAAIDAAGVSDRSVFEAAGVADGTWHRVIRLGVGGFRTEQVVRIAAALDVAPSQLIPDVREQVSA